MIRLYVTCICVINLFYFSSTPHPTPTLVKILYRYRSDGVSHISQKCMIKIKWANWKGPDSFIIYLYFTSFFLRVSWILPSSKFKKSIISCRVLWNERKQVFNMFRVKSFPLLLKKIKIYLNRNAFLWEQADIHFSKKLSGSFREAIEESNLPWLGRVIESKVTSQLQAH